MPLLNKIISLYSWFQDTLRDLGVSYKAEEGSIDNHDQGQMTEEEYIHSTITCRFRLKFNADLNWLKTWCVTCL